jgi:hypothetical protein
MIADPLIGDIHSFRHNGGGEGRFMFMLPKANQATAFELLCGKKGVSCFGCCRRKKLRATVVKQRDQNGEGKQEEGSELETWAQRNTRIASLRGENDSSQRLADDSGGRDSFVEEEFFIPRLPNIVTIVQVQMLLLCLYISNYICHYAFRYELKVPYLCSRVLVLYCTRQPPPHMHRPSNSLVHPRLFFPALFLPLFLPLVPSHSTHEMSGHWFDVIVLSTSMVNMLFVMPLGIFLGFFLELLAEIDFKTLKDLALEHRKCSDTLRFMMAIIGKDFHRLLANRRGGKTALASERDG